MVDFAIRYATPDDADQVYDFVCKLAKYENQPDDVKMSAKTLRSYMEKPIPPFECLLVEEQESNKPIGMALLFTTFSTWEGPGWWLEDLYVEEEYRGQGVGTALWQILLNTARERNYSRFEWSVLDWNDSANKFYRSRGARPVDGWTTWRLNLTK